MSVAFLPITLTALVFGVSAAETQPDIVDRYPVRYEEISGSNDPFSALVGKRSEKRRTRTANAKVERYVIATDDRAFLFQKNGTNARLKFLCREQDPRLDCRLDQENSAEEIFSLNTTTGPRGDLIFKDMRGETILRIASYGGATVFWPGESTGQAASKSFGEETSLRLPFADIGTVERRAQSATAFLSATTGTPILIDLGRPVLDETSGGAVLADAIVRAVSGVYQVASDPTGAGVIADRIDRIRLIHAQVPELSLDGKTLEVRYNAANDLAGRPSSTAVARFLEETL